MEVLVEVKGFLECFGVQEVGVWEVWPLKDGKVQEVSGDCGVFMCKSKTGMKGVKFIKEGDKFLCGARPDEENVINISC